MIEAKLFILVLWKHSWKSGTHEHILFLIDLKKYIWIRHCNLFLKNMLLFFPLPKHHTQLWWCSLEHDCSTAISLIHPLHFVQRYMFKFH